jgi:hypothetical protein
MDALFKRAGITLPGPAAKPGAQAVTA